MGLSLAKFQGNEIPINQFLPIPNPILVYHETKTMEKAVSVLH